MEMTILILTPIAVENDAVRQYLPDIQDEIVDGTSYGIARFQTKKHTCRIVLLQCKPKPQIVAQATERSVRLFHPDVVILTGIAAKIKDAKPGDIVVGTKAYGYESGKSTKDGFLVRPEVYQYSHSIVALAEIIARKKQWHKKGQDIPENLEVHFGPIASGNAVINSTSSPLYKRIKQSYNDTIALEMESIGFAQAMSYFPLIPYANIRSISDEVDGKTQADAEGAQEIASRHAAAFVFELIDNLEVPSLKMVKMDMNTLSQRLVKSILSFINNKDNQANYSYLNVIKTKVEGLIPDAYREFTQAPNDPATQGFFQISLRKKLEMDRTLQQEFVALLENNEQNQRMGDTIISNSKNFINNSTLSSNENLQIGDTVNYFNRKREDR